MKKLFFVFFMVFSFASAGDIKTISESSNPLIAAINSAAKLGFGDAFIIPEYGVGFYTTPCKKFNDNWVQDWQAIKGMVAALGQMVKGLNPDEWFSLNIIYSCDFTNGDTHVTARVKAATLNKPETWEVWVNGVKQ